MSETKITVFYRPVGAKELELIRQSGFREFPPRLPSQPIFYPVLNEEYTIAIARNWNAKGPNKGYVTRFGVNSNFLTRYQIRTVGGYIHQEYWIPAEELQEFNANIIGNSVVGRNAVYRWADPCAGADSAIFAAAQLRRSHDVS